METADDASFGVFINRAARVETTMRTNANAAPPVQSGQDKTRALLTATATTATLATAATTPAILQATATRRGNICSYNCFGVKCTSNLSAPGLRHFAFSQAAGRWFHLQRVVTSKRCVYSIYCHFEGGNCILVAYLFKFTAISCCWCSSCLLLRSN